MNKRRFDNTESFIYSAAFDRVTKICYMVIQEATPFILVISMGWGELKGYIRTSKFLQTLKAPSMLV